MDLSEFWSKSGFSNYATTYKENMLIFALTNQIFTDVRLNIK